MKTFFSKWYRKLLEKAAVELKRISDQNLPRANTYASLSADDDVPETEIKQYVKALSWALNGSQLKNIALTGPYGSGKSSILLSFQRQHPQYRFLSISLASFAPAKVEPEGQEPGKVIQEPGKIIKVDATELEQSIVKQIFYSSDPSDIPDTTISRRQGLGKRGLWLLTAAVAGWILCIIYLTRIGFKRQPLVVSDLMLKYGNWLDWIAYILFIGGAVALLHKAVVSLRKFALDKFKFSTTNLEVEGQNTRSVLNRNVDELLYFFTVKKYHGLIIEDLDRFRNTDIFTNLRALNILLNNSVRFKKKPLVFIYAIQDDLFSVNDRTKFFDFIIPVIPVVNSSNAGEQLLKLLQDGNHAQNLDASFVLTIGSYVRDMRMVKNIFNEYVMYKDKIGIEAEFKLLGMIAYKNIYPEDFSALHEGNGMIHDIFANKESVVVQKSAGIAEEIKELEARVTKLEVEIAQNVTELNSIYVLKLVESFSFLERIYIGNESFQPAELVVPEAFNKLRKEISIQYSSRNGQRRDSKLSFSNLEEKVDPIRSYEDRLSVVKSREILDLPAVRRLLTGKIAYRERQKSLSLLELLKSSPMSDFSIKVSQEPLLGYLLGSGAIDELYQLYISNFYEGALKKNDQLFLIDVKTKTRRSPEYTLVNIEEMTKRLNADDFARPEVLNFDLTEFLFKHQTRYGHYLGALSDQLKTCTNEVWTYIQACIEQKRFSIFGVIPDLWPEFWRDLSLRYKDLDELLVTYISILLMENAPQRLKYLDENSVLSSFIKTYFVAIRIGLPGHSYTEDQLTRISSRLEHLVDILELKVSTIDAGLSLNSPVYTNSRYAIALHNFETWIAAHGSENFDEVLGEGILTRIFNSQLDIMKAYCQTHITEVVDLIVSNPGSESESPEVALLILNDPALSTERKARFIEAVEFRLPNVGVLNIEGTQDDDSKLVLTTLLSCRKFIVNWENVLDLYRILGLNEQLTDLLDEVTRSEKTAVLLNSFSPGSEELSERLHVFTREVVQSEKIDDGLYLRLIAVLPLLSADILEVTPKSLLRKLIEGDHLSLSQEHVSLLEDDEELLAEFLFRNMENLTQVQLTSKHFESLLDTPLSDEQKNLLVEALTEEKLRNQARLIDAVSGYIETGIVANPRPSIVDIIFQSAVAEAQKVAIFKILTGTNTYDEMIRYLPNIGYSYDKLNTGTEQFDKEDLDVEILQYLKNHGFIEGFLTNEGTIEVQRKVITN